MIEVAIAVSAARLRTSLRMAGDAFLNLMRQFVGAMLTNLLAIRQYSPAATALALERSAAHYNPDWAFFREGPVGQPLHVVRDEGQVDIDRLRFETCTLRSGRVLRPG